VHGGWNHEHDLDNAGFIDGIMKQKIVTALWTVGYSFLALWTCFLIWLVMDTGKINLGMFLRIALGVFVLWQGFTKLREKWKTLETRN